ncbi:SagB/ThcOx family dehydrogenase [Mycoplasmatota bacterium WC30]
MPSDKVKQLILKGREFLKLNDFGVEELSDQQKKLPQPPLTKGKMTSSQKSLPINFEDLEIDPSILNVLNKRQSHRVYTEETMSLLQLSYLLWTTQGIKSIRGNNYATLRTVPSGGARHEFETYFIVKNVENLEVGTYHYLPLTHEIEFLGKVENLEESVTAALLGQSWANKANIIFFWSVIPYRSEWRYSCFSHRIILVDIGHVCQNLYIASESIGLGTCAIGAFNGEACDLIFGLDGKEEFTILASPVGNVSKENAATENEFYAFLKTQKE